eukprot:COSAG01_NODE_4017_length_5430_cov_4.544926_5_plen_87_part_00
MRAPREGEEAAHLMAQGRRGAGRGGLQPCWQDSLSGVASGVFETAFMHGRRTTNKLGCDGGYRSDITMVPDLALGIFAVATSTCDL